MAIPYAADSHSQSSVSLQPPAKPLRPRASLSSLLLRPQKKGPQNLVQQLSPRNEFIEQEGPFRLILNSDLNSSGQPEYSNGSTITGSFNISKAPSLLDVEIRLTGKMSVQEIGGGFMSNSVMFSRIIYEWGSDVSPRPPKVIPLDYTFPSKYIDEDTGLHHMVPPSYKARYNTIPGFKVRVFYEVTATITHSRQKSRFWKTCTRITIPVTYKPRYLPQYPAPPPSGQRSRAPTRNSLSHMQKVFGYFIQPRHHDKHPIETRLYLPFGQICLLDEPIPFVIKVFAEDDILDDFAAATPPASNPNDNFSSFHPLSDQTSRFSTSSVMSRPKSPRSRFQIKVELRRMTTIAARPSWRSGDTTLEEDRNIFGCAMLYEGPIQSMTRGSGWIAWSGQIIIPPEITTSGFSASHLSVSDEIIFSILPTNQARSPFFPFCESISLQLTARSQVPRSTPLVNVYAPKAAKPPTSYSSSDSSSSSSSSSSLLSRES